MGNEVIEDFIYAIKEQILYWDKQDLDSKHKMEGLVFSILTILDGMSGSFDGNIKTIEKDSRGIMLHECFYKKDTSDGN